MSDTKVVIADEDNRSLLEILRDVHLTNIGLKNRTFDEQIADRLYLQDCLACWDLANAHPPIRNTVEKVLMERYWLIGDEVRYHRKPVREDNEHQLKPLLEKRNNERALIERK